ncbi:hypothetical protein D3C86_1862060 [compost metagenome]
MENVHPEMEMPSKSHAVKVQPENWHPVQPACLNVHAAKLVPVKTVVANWARFRSRPA